MIKSIIGFLGYSVCKKFQKTKNDLKKNWKKKIFSFLNNINPNLFLNDICFENSNKNIWSRNWKEIKFNQEIFFLIHDFTRYLHPTNFQIVAIPLIIFRFNFMAEKSPGMGKTFLFFIWILNTSWKNFPTKKFHDNKRKNLIIISDSIEFSNQLNCFLIKTTFSLNFSSYLRKNNSKRWEKIYRIKIFNFKSFFFFTKNHLLQISEINYFAIEYNSDLHSSFYFQKIKAILNYLTNCNNQLIFFSEKKSIEEIFISEEFKIINFQIEIKKKILEFYSHQKFEFFQTSYDKISRLMVVLKKKKKKKIIVYLKSKMRCIFISNLIDIFFGKKFDLKNQKLKIMQRKKKIAFINFDIFLCSEFSLLLKFGFLFTYILNFDPLPSSSFSNEKIFFFEKKNKLQVIISFFLISEKFFFLKTLEKFCFE